MPLAAIHVHIHIHIHIHVRVHMYNHFPDADAFRDEGDFATVVKIAAKFKFDMRQAESQLEPQLESVSRLASFCLFSLIYPIINKAVLLDCLHNNEGYLNAQNI